MNRNLVRGLLLVGAPVVMGLGVASTASASPLPPSPTVLQEVEQAPLQPVLVEPCFTADQILDYLNGS